MRNPAELTDVIAIHLTVGESAVEFQEFRMPTSGAALAAESYREDGGES